VRHELETDDPGEDEADADEAVKGNQGTAILANFGLDTSPDNKPRPR
jgi:hypothetical protein